MKAIAFDAFGTLIKVTNGGSARTILNNITAGGGSVDEKAFMAEWKAYYKDHTKNDCPFMKERDIFISRIQMFYDRYGVKRDAAEDADALLSGAFERESYPEAKTVLDKLRMKYPVFIASNTDNNVLDSVMRKNNITADKIYTSEDLKCYKPDRRFFDSVLAVEQKLGVSALRVH